MGAATIVSHLITSACKAFSPLAACHLIFNAQLTWGELGLKMEFLPLELRAFLSLFRAARDGTLTYSDEAMMLNMREINVCFVRFVNMYVTGLGKMEI